MNRIDQRRLLSRVSGLTRPGQMFRHASEFIGTVAVAGFTSMTRQTLDPVVCRAVHWSFVTLRPGSVLRIARRIEQTNGSDPEGAVTSESLDAARLYWLMRIEVGYGEARGAGRRAWTPTVSIEGLEHLERSLNAGHGAILWRMSFTSATAVNSGLKTAGFDVVHLSSDHHRGANRSWFARRVSAPLYTRSEARWLERRVLRVASGNLGYLKTLRNELLGNAVVTIVGDLTSGRYTETHKIGNVTHEVPTGAPSLAYSTGAGLHTCVALRDGPFCYRLLIGPDIVEARTGPKSSARRAATARFANEVENRLSSSPESALWWGRR